MLRRVVAQQLATGRSMGTGGAYLGGAQSRLS
jgi:hypothetical protein